MSASDGSDKARDLAATLLRATPAPADEPAATSNDTVEGDAAPSGATRLTTLLPFPEHVDALPADNEAALAAIEEYFEADDPVERDLLLERLAGNPSVHATDFFEAALTQDEDLHVQAQAAEALCRRGHPSGTEALFATLKEPEDITFFNHAVQVLSAVQGETLAEVLLALWHDRERTLDERREALLGLEHLRPAVAVEAALTHLDAAVREPALDDDELALIVTLLVRQDAHDALPRLEALRARLRAAANEDDTLLLDELDAACELLAAAG